MRWDALAFRCHLRAHHFRSSCRRRPHLALLSGSTRRPPPSLVNALAENHQANLRRNRISDSEFEALWGEGLRCYIFRDRIRELNVHDFVVRRWRCAAAAAAAAWSGGGGGGRCDGSGGGLDSGWHLDSIAKGAGEESAWGVGGEGAGKEGWEGGGRGAT